MTEGTITLKNGNKIAMINKTGDQVKGFEESNSPGSIIHIDQDYVKLTKNTKGYQWDIKVVAKEGIDVLQQIHDIDTDLRSKYCTVEVAK